MARKKKSASTVADMTGRGPEPKPGSTPYLKMMSNGNIVDAVATYEPELTGATLIEALSWYTMPSKELLAKAISARPNFRKEAKLAEDFDIVTACKLVLLVGAGFTFNFDVEAKIKSILASAVEKKKRRAEAIVVVAESTAPKKTAQDRILEKNQFLIGEIEETIDKDMRGDLEKFSAYEYLVGLEINPINAKFIMEYYAEWAKSSKFVKQIYDAAGMLAANVKRQRRARKRKVATSETLTTKFQYKDRALEFGLESVSPASIIGSKELWTYDTEKRLLTVLRGENLTIRGTTVYGYEEDKSAVKKIRKPEEFFGSFMTLNKVGMKKAFGNLSTVELPRKLSGRNNENTIILKTFK